MTWPDLRRNVARQEGALGHLVVVVSAWLRNQATCSCGWTGKRRTLTGAAKIDALLHTADTGHEPGIPFLR